MAAYRQIVICPQCRKSREVRGNTAASYDRLCQRCNAKASGARQKVNIVLDSSPPVKAPHVAIYQAPCIEGKAHHWDLSQGIDNAYCLKGCRQKPAPGRWTAETPKGPPGLLEKQPY